VRPEFFKKKYARLTAEQRAAVDAGRAHLTRSGRLVAKPTEFALAERPVAGGVFLAGNPNAARVKRRTPPLRRRSRTTLAEG
jgi:hypothetical protein